MPGSGVFQRADKRTVAWGSGTINTTQASLQVTDFATGAYKMIPAGSRTVGQLPLVTGGALPVQWGILGIDCSLWPAWNSILQTPSTNSELSIPFHPLSFWWDLPRFG